MMPPRALGLLALALLAAACGDDDTSDPPPDGSQGGKAGAAAGQGGKAGSAQGGAGQGGSGGSGGSAGAGGSSGQGGSGQGGEAGASAGASGAGAAGSSGASGQSGAGQGGSAQGGAGQGGAGQAGSSAGGQAGAGGSSGGGQGGSGGGGLQCSADLHEVVDEFGQTVEVCASDKGCAGGKCVEACEAAAASRGNVGCRFSTPTPRTYGATLQPCYAVFLANTWTKPAKVDVKRGGAAFDATQFGRVVDNAKPPTEWAAIPADGIPVGQVGVLFLSSDPKSVFLENGIPLTCPAPTATGGSTEVAGSGVGQAFEIGVDVPVSAYDIFPFGGARSHFPSAQLLFPTSTWGTNFVVIGTPRGTASSPGPLFGQVLALEEDTTVQIASTVDLPESGPVGAIASGTPTSFKLGAGQYLQWQLAAGSNDLSGSVLLSDKPISVVPGSRFYRQQPLGEQPGGEASHTQVPPVTALSSEYVAAPYETRRKDLKEETIYYRVVGAFDGTTLSYEPPVAGAPASLGRGEVVDFTAVGAFVVRSQDAEHPFAMAQVMPSANVPSGSREGALVEFPGLAKALGDEEFVVMLPPAQFLSRYVFFTDPTYATTTLAVTRRKGPDGFRDVVVDCLGKLGGWQPVGADYEVTRVDLLRAGKSSGGCTNGRQQAQSEGPFGVVVWGLDTYASYGYQAGGNAAPLTKLVIKP